MRRFASPTEVAALRKDERSMHRAEAQLREKASKEELKAIAELGERGPGQVLRNIYQTRFDRALASWLDGDSGDAVKAIETHQELRDCREIVRYLTPREEPNATD